MTCAECSSSSFRLSRFRMEDVERLLLLQYPVRCRKCLCRAYAELPLAVVLLQADRVRHERREHEAARRRASYLADDGLSDRILAGVLTSWISSACDAFAVTACGVRIKKALYVPVPRQRPAAGNQKSQTVHENRSEHTLADRSDLEDWAHLQHIELPIGTLYETTLRTSGRRPNNGR
jgi:hypothetical protein